MAEPTPIKFPVPKPRDPILKLALPRRRSASALQGVPEVADVTSAVRHSVNELVAATRSPFGSVPVPAKVVDLEHALRELETNLNLRQRVITETESRLADRERDLAEAEALLLARERLVSASAKPAAQPVSEEERVALIELRAELSRQEASIIEAKQFLRERELYLEEAETKLFEKVQAQQDTENELEQREEDLRARMRRVREREAALDPQAAAALRAEDEAAKKRDEYNE